MIRTLYVVGCLKENMIISAREQNLLLEVPCTWAAGMCGAFPAFWELKDAEAYRDKFYDGNRYAIEEFAVETPTVQ